MLIDSKKEQSVVWLAHYQPLSQMPLAIVVALFKIRFLQCINKSYAKIVL